MIPDEEEADEEKEEAADEEVVAGEHELLLSVAIQCRRRLATAIKF